MKKEYIQSEALLDEIEELFEKKSLQEIQSIFSNNKDKILEIVKNMFSFLRARHWADDWYSFLPDVIILGGTDFSKFVSILSLANEYGVDVHDIVVEYLDWLVETTEWFSDTSHIAVSTCDEKYKVDVRDVLINPLFKPLFTLIIEMCKSGHSEDLFIKLCDFCNFINGYSNHSIIAEKVEDTNINKVSSTREILNPSCKLGFNKRVFSLCLRAFTKRANYEQLGEYLDYIQRLDSYNLSTYTKNNSKEFYEEVLSHIKDAKRSKINLQLIKESNSQFSLLKEKYPEKSDIRLLSFMIKNKQLEESARRGIKLIKERKRSSSRFTNMSYEEWYELVYDYM